MRGGTGDAREADRSQEQRYIRAMAASTEAAVSASYENTYVRPLTECRWIGSVAQ